MTSLTCTSAELRGVDSATTSNNSGCGTFARRWPLVQLKHWIRGGKLKRILVVQLVHVQGPEQRAIKLSLSTLRILVQGYVLPWREGGTAASTAGNLATVKPASVSMTTCGCKNGPPAEAQKCCDYVSWHFSLSRFGH